MDNNTQELKRSTKPWKIIIPLILLAVLGICCLGSAVAYTLTKKNFNSAISDSLKSIQTTSIPTPTSKVEQTPTRTPQNEPSITPTQTPSATPDLSKKQNSSNCNLTASMVDSGDWKLEEKTDDFYMLKFTTVKILHTNTSTIEVICADNNGFISVDDLFTTAQKELQDKGVNLKTRSDETIWGRNVKVVEASSTEGNVTLYAFTTKKKIYIVRKDITTSDQNLKDVIEKTFQKLEFSE